MKSPTARQVALVLIVALGLRLAAGWCWQSRLEGRFLFGDSQGYWALTRSIADGLPYQYGEDAKVFRTPGYPLLLSPIFLLAGDDPSVLWARSLGAVFGTLTVGGIWWLARQLFDARIAMIAAIIAALYPGAIITSVLVLSEAAFCPLMLAQLILWTAACRGQSVGHVTLLSVGAGLTAGAAALVRPSWLLFVPFAMAVGLAANPQRKRHLAICAAMLTGLIVAMMPWWIRNARLTGHFVPTTLQVGASLYDGLNPDATGASDMRFVPRLVEAERQQPAAVAGDPSDVFEYRLDGRMRAEANRWAGAHPGRVARLAGMKFLRMWNLWPNERSLSTWPIRLAVLCTYVPVMVLAILGAVKTIRSGWPYILCWLPAVYLTLLHVVFVSSIRYRQPAMLSLIVLAAGMIALRSGTNGKGVS